MSEGLITAVEVATIRSPLPVTPHMFAHVHSRVFDVPIEWGVPGGGVDQFADSLPQPVVRDGLMEPLAGEPGLGPQANPAWIAEQIVDDPDGVVERLA